jgi:hypothetical protein
MHLTTQHCHYFSPYAHRPCRLPLVQKPPSRAITTQATWSRRIHRPFLSVPTSRNPLSMIIPFQSISVARIARVFGTRSMKMRGVRTRSTQLQNFQTLILIFKTAGSLSNCVMCRSLFEQFRSNAESETGPVPIHPMRSLLSEGRCHNRLE